MITNLLGLPEPLVQAVANDPYEKGDCDFSATELISPPHMKFLQRRHKAELKVDASDRIWALFGQAVHAILERSPGSGYVLERRYIAHVGKYRVGAKIDVLDSDTMTLDDYKVTSVYKFKSDERGYIPVPPEYEAQMNIQAECIFQETTQEIKKARIIGILRDWRPSERLRGQGYPKFKVMPMEIPLWPRDKRMAYLEERIKLHSEAAPEPCSASDMWERPTWWALMKEGQERAVRLYKDPDKAHEAHVSMTHTGKGEFYVQKRPGSRPRCEEYCEVSAFCEQHKKYKEAKNA